MARLVAFAAPLPADASQQERLVTMRARLAQLRQQVRRVEAAEGLFRDQ